MPDVSMGLGTVAALAASAVETTKQGMTFDAFLVVASQGPGSDSWTMSVDGVSFHRNYWWHDGPLWLLVAGQWVRSGTFKVVIDNIAQTVGQSHSVGVSSGAFQIRQSSIGEFDGTWAWNWRSAGDDGYGLGDSAPGSRSRGVTVTFCQRQRPGLPPPPADPGDGGPVIGVRYLRLATA